MPPEGSGWPGRSGRRLWSFFPILSALVATTLAGCGEILARPEVVAVTCWSPARRADFESELASTGYRPSIRWIEIVPSDGLVLIRRKSAGADVALGVAPAVLNALILEDGAPRYNLGGPSLGFVAEPGRTPPADWADAATSAHRGKLAFDDPRRDWTTFRAESAGLPPNGWATGYASLVLAAGNARRGGPAELSLALGIDGPTGDSGVFHSLPNKPAAASVAGLLKNPVRPEAAARLLQAVAPLGTEVDSLAKPDVNIDADSLLADLLGATLGNARNELRRAVASLDALTDADRKVTLTRYLTESPPWPPASVGKIRERPTGEELLATLAAEMVPDRPSREWLLARWREPLQSIDGAFLERLAKAEDGKLVAEPRFRAWLRAEWGAWAEQRYRRVARAAGGGFAP